MINRTRFQLSNKCLYQEKQDKDLIVLHFTSGGSASSAVSWWNKMAGRVSTPYVLDTDGTIYELYKPDNWAHHLGIRESDPQYLNDKRTIGIEICNFGPLKPLGDTLNSWPRNFTNRYCSLSDKDKYVETEYRGFKYYAAFTEPQKVSIGFLVDDLCVRFGIKKVIAPEGKRDEFDLPFFSKWKGIATHANFRADKFDISWKVFDRAWLGL